MKGLILWCVWLISGVIYAQSASFLEQIRQEEAVLLQITTDWKEMIKEKKEKAYAPAQLTSITASGDTLQMDVRVRPRGNMRLNICDVPPIKIKVDKELLALHGLSPMNELDVVQHCYDTEQHVQLILREYLAYKIWELLSPHHFKTQLVQLSYLHTDGSIAFRPSYAFLVEDTEEVVSRLGARRNKTAIMSQDAIEKKPFLRTCLFQFMIGNTDWFVTNRHNLEFVGVPGHSLLIPMPYDFDYSGLVNASYAVPHESLDLSSVTVRYYQGHCHSREEVEEELRVFREQKEAILLLPAKIQGLDSKSVKYCTNYLKEFYDIIEQPKKLENQILRHCDRWPVRK